MDRNDKIAWAVSAILAGVGCLVICVWMFGAKVDPAVFLVVICLLFAPALVKCGVHLRFGWCEFGNAEARTEKNPGPESKKEKDD